MRHPDHCDVVHLGVHDQLVLDLLWIDVDAPGDDHERHPVRQVEIALVVDAADVAKSAVQPWDALGCCAPRVFSGVFVVGEGHLVSLEVHDACLSGREAPSPPSSQMRILPITARPTVPGVGQPVLQTRRMSSHSASVPAVVLVQDRPPPGEHLLPSPFADRVRLRGSPRRCAVRSKPCALFLRKLQHP